MFQMTSFSLESPPQLVLFASNSFYITVVDLRLKLQVRHNCGNINQVGEGLWVLVRGIV